MTKREMFIEEFSTSPQYETMRVLLRSAVCEAHKLGLPGDFVCFGVAWNFEKAVLGRVMGSLGFKNWEEPNDQP